jgi:hypothetical protein
MHRAMILFLVATAFASNADQSYFEEVVSHPRAFHDKSISLVGLALIDGDRFYLFESATAAARVDLSRAVFVRQKEHGPSYDQYNNRWLKVTGILDADLHGPLGLGFPCEILLKNVAVLKRPPEKQWPSDVGFFRNEMRSPIRVALSYPDGFVYGECDVGPDGVNGMAVHSGQVTITTGQGTAVIKSDLVIPPRTRQPVEPVERKFYYRITSRGQFQAVPAAAARQWER